MIEELRVSIERLVALYENERKGREELASSLVISQSEIADLRRRNAELTERLKKLELSRAFADNNTSAEAKSSIDRLVRQIDGCIKLMED